MDRHRFERRSRELTECAKLVGDLTRVPDRATAKDFQQAADMMKGAASDLDELIKATPAGCICRRIEHDDYSYLDYAETCLHHRQLYMTREQLKADYAKMERALKNEVRMKIVVAALTGAASLSDADDVLVKNAISIADEAIRRIAREEIA